MCIAYLCLSAELGTGTRELRARRYRRGQPRQPLVLGPEHDPDPWHVDAVEGREELVRDANDGTDGALALERHCHGDRPGAPPSPPHLRRGDRAELEMDRVGKRDLSGDARRPPLLDASLEPEEAADGEEHNGDGHDRDRGLWLQVHRRTHLSLTGAASNGPAC